MTKNNSNYNNSKHNAITHGILSKSLLLEWENKEDYENLLQAFEKDYNPTGITECYLVTELAQIIWRKKRLRMGERSVVKYNLNSIDNWDRRKIKSIAEYGNKNFNMSKHKFEDFIMLSEQETKHQIRHLSNYNDNLNKLYNETYTYDEYMQKVDDVTKDAWLLCIANRKDEFKQNIDSFKRFLELHINWYQEHINALQFCDSIKDAAVSESFRPTEEYVNLARYESHLDRKFEKTLTMLLKLQEIRKNVPLNEITG